VGPLARSLPRLALAALDPARYRQNEMNGSAHRAPLAPGRAMSTLFTTWSPLTRTLVACAIALPFVAAAWMAPRLGVTPLLALGFLCGPFAMFVWFGVRRPMIIFVASFAALAPIDFLLIMGGGATVTRFIGIGAVGTLALGLLARGSRMPPRFVVVWLIAFAWMVASLVWAGDQPKSIERLSQTALPLLMVTLVAMSRCDRTDLRALIAAIAGGGTFVALYAIYVGHQFKPEPGRINLVNGNAQMEPNGVALALLPAFALGLAAAVSTGTPLKRITGLAVVCAVGAAVLATQSRGGVLALGVMLVWSAIRVRQPLVTFAMVAIGAVMAVTQNAVFARFLDSTSSANAEGAGRVPIWQVGIEAFRQHWLIGNGYGTFSDAYNQAYLLVPHHFNTGWSREAHDLIISCFVELGVFGGGLVLYAWWRQFRELSSIPATDPDAWLRLAAEFGILGVFVAALFMDVSVLKPAWIVPLLIAAVASVRAGERRESPVPTMERPTYGARSAPAQRALVET
jgi:O-antigen ligase